MNDEVLIVEDSAHDAYFLLRALNGLAPKIRFVFEQCPEEATLRLANQGQKRPILLLLDLRMPKFSGHHFLKHMADNGLADIPVVVVTSSSDEEEKHAVLDAGARAFFTKPDSLTGYDQLAAQIVQTYLPQPAP